MQLRTAATAIVSVLAIPLQAEMTPREMDAAAARVDAALEAALAKQSDRSVNRWALPTPVTKEASDAEFLRRVTIDLACRLPTAAEARAFVLAPTHTKRAALINRLAKEAASGAWRFERLADPLRVTDEVLGVSQAGYIDWLRRACAQDMPLDRMILSLLSARGTLAENAEAGLLLRDYGVVQITTAELARAFLGEDIHCAGCHDHPFSDQTQRGFYEFAACLNVVHARSESEPSPAGPHPPRAPGARGGPHRSLPAGRNAQDVMPKQPNADFFKRLELAQTAGPLVYPPDYKYRNAKPGELVAPRCLPLKAVPGDDPHFSMVSLASQRQLRDKLAAWFASREKGPFTTIAAIRIWDWMFGVPGRSLEERTEAGFTDPEPPQALWNGKGCGQSVAFSYGSWLQTHPDFAHMLRLEFERCDCRIGVFQQILARTRAYQREALLPDGLGQTRLSPAPVVRRLPAEVVWNALVDWLPPSLRQDQWMEANALAQVPSIDHPLRVLGRGSRQWADESRPSISHALARMLIAAPVVDYATASNSALVGLATAASGKDAAVETLFLAILGRSPLEDERAAALAHLGEEPGAALSDLSWALLNTTEFLFEH